MLFRTLAAYICTGKAHARVARSQAIVLYSREVAARGHKASILGGVAKLGEHVGVETDCVRANGSPLGATTARGRADQRDQRVSAGARDTQGHRRLLDAAVASHPHRRRRPANLPLHLGLAHAARAVHGGRRGWDEPGRVFDPHPPHRSPGTLRARCAQVYAAARGICERLTQL